MLYKNKIIPSRLHKVVKYQSVNKKCGIGLRENKD